MANDADYSDEMPNIDPTPDGGLWNGQNGQIEDFLRDMLESARPPPRPMLDEQIPGDVTPRQPSRDSRMPQINPEMGPPVPFADPGFGPQLHTVNPHVRMDEGMDQMEEDPSHVWKYNTDKIDNAELLVQQMIHQRLNNRKFR